MCKTLTLNHIIIFYQISSDNTLIIFKTLKLFLGCENVNFKILKLYSRTN